MDPITHKWTALVERADESKRRYVHELRVAWRAIRELRDDPGETHQAFTAVENFPLLDIVKWHNGRLPILKDPVFVELWEKRSMPDLSTPAALAMKQLAPGTLGHEFACFVEARKLDNIFLEYLTIDSPEKFFAYRMAHLHDLFHFLLGYDPYEPIGEMEVEAFLHAQSGALNHVLFLIGYVRFLLRNDWRTLWHGRHRLAAARRLGQRTPKFLLQSWQEMMSRPIEQVRADLGIAQRRLLPAEPRPHPRVAPRLAHVVYNVPDLRRAEHFYRRVYGYEITAHDRTLGVTFLSDGTDHHTLALQECLSLHPLRIVPSLARGARRLFGLLRSRWSKDVGKDAGRRRALPPLAIVRASLRPGLNHLGYRVESEDDLRAYYYLLRSKGVRILWAVNHGDMIKSFYVRDPAGNTCELFVDGEKAHALAARKQAGELVSDSQQEDLPTFTLDLVRDLGIALPH